MAAFLSHKLCHNGLPEAASYGRLILPCIRVTLSAWKEVVGEAPEEVEPVYCFFAAWIFQGLQRISTYGRLIKTASNVKLTDLPASHDTALFPLQCLIASVRVEKLDEAIRLFYGNLS